MAGSQYFTRDQEKYKDKKYSQSYKGDKLNKRKNFLRIKYGVTPEWYDMMYDIQEGRCAICGVHQSELSKLLAIDHDHTTGQTRGLLCSNCNQAIGQMSDNPERIRKAADYLESFQKKVEQS